MKNILITGCSTGFGFLAAKHFSDKNYNVFASMRNANGKNASAAEELKKHGATNQNNIQVIELDVTSDESVQNAVSGLPAMDVLINNAGLGYGGPLEAFSSAQVLEQLDVNIVGTVRVAKAVLPGMRKQKSGLIIQLSSIAGRGAFPGFSVYHASKWGLEGLSEAMRYELAPLGIDVVMVEPGPFATNFFGNVVPPSDEEIGTAYQHVNDFLEGFGQQVEGAFENADAPTDPMLVVNIFDKLIETPAGQRPLRTIAGLDFGFQALNDAVEPLRKASLASMGIEALDGPSVSVES